MPDYGKELKSTVVQGDARHPIKMSIIDQHDKIWLDIRRMWWDDDELRHGKGVRIEVDDDVAEEVLLATQALLEEYMLW